MPDDRTTVLTVEDEPDLADLYSEWLERAGYQTRTANDGTEATEAIDEHVDVVLLDRRLPGTCGRKLLEYVHESGHDCRIAMVTAVEPEADIVEMGFDEYIIKPVEQSELTAVVEELSTDIPAGIDDPTLDALGDPKARRCFYELQEDPKSARELSAATGYSTTTVYRRLNSLRQAGLIESRTTIDPNGDHYESFLPDTELIMIELYDGFRVRIDPKDGG